jgi:hypothetical protein
MTDSSVEQLVRTILDSKNDWQALLSTLEPFARTCGTCDGTGFHDEWDSTHSYQYSVQGCPNPDCIDGKEYVSAAREIDRKMMLADAWWPFREYAPTEFEAWLHIGPKLLIFIEDVQQVVLRKSDPYERLNVIHNAAQAIRREVKEAGLV